MAYPSFDKDPHEVLDYQIDWSEWLDGDTPDTIDTSTWHVPDGITMDTDANTTTTATIWLSGGTAGEVYTVTNHITTAGGRTGERSINIKVKER
jgi:hypothetical protein